MYASMGRSIEHPWGLNGGGEGSCNYVEVESEGKRWRGARIPATPMRRGDRVRIVTGGGFGDPMARPAPDVAADVLDGYIGADAARTDYGVAIAGEAVDESTTDALRQHA